METSTATSTVGPEVTVVHQPASGADDQKPIPAEPASAADVEKTETPEQIQAKQEKQEMSRRARSNARKAAELAEARTEARLLRERLDKLEAQGAPKPQADAEPERNGIDPKTGEVWTYEAWVRACAAHDAKKETAAVLKADREEREKGQKQQQARTLTEKAAKDWSEREKSFEEATKDYAEVADAFTGRGGALQELSQDARDLLIESEVGPALLYNLAKLEQDDPAEWDRIAGLSPRRQVAELGKLEAKATMPAARTTKAPAPARPATGGRTAATDLEKMSQDEYEAHRKTQGARWAR